MRCRPWRATRLCLLQRNHATETMSARSSGERASVRVAPQAIEHVATILHYHHRRSIRFGIRGFIAMHGGAAPVAFGSTRRGGNYPVALQQPAALAIETVANTGPPCARWRRQRWLPRLQAGSRWSLARRNRSLASKRHGRPHRRRTWSELETVTRASAGDKEILGERHVGDVEARVP